MRTLRNTSLALLALLAADPTAATEGEQVYVKACAMCHNAMPPKLGDKKAWEPRLQQGREALVAAVIKGKGAMPPKAGNPALSEKDIEAAVDYMLSQVQ
jgi:cytochrome c5